MNQHGIGDIYKRETKFQNGACNILLEERERERERDMKCHTTMDYVFAYLCFVTSNVQFLPWE